MSRGLRTSNLTAGTWWMDLGQFRVILLAGPEYSKLYPRAYEVRARWAL